MSLNDHSKFPSRRAYVVKLRNDAEPSALRGRIENLLTCEQREFESAAELVERIESDLAASGPTNDRG